MMWYCRKIAGKNGEVKLFKRGVGEFFFKGHFDEPLAL